MSENKQIFGGQILPEVDLLEALNIEKPTLDALRTEKGFPFVRLTSKERVYVVEDVVAWLKEHRRNATN
jgi:hypothetical protein